MARRRPSLGYLSGGGPFAARIVVRGAAAVSTISTLLVTGMKYPVSDLGLISGTVLFPGGDTENPQTYVWFLREMQGANTWEIVMRPES